MVIINSADHRRFLHSNSSAVSLAARAGAYTHICALTSNDSGGARTPGILPLTHFTGLQQSFPLLSLGSLMIPALCIWCTSKGVRFARWSIGKNEQLSRAFLLSAPEGAPELPQLPDIPERRMCKNSSVNLPTVWYELEQAEVKFPKVVEEKPGAVNTISRLSRASNEPAAEVKQRRSIWKLEGEDCSPTAMTAV